MQFKKAYAHENSTGSGDTEHQTLIEQCLEICPWYDEFKAIFGTRPKVTPISGITSTGFTVFPNSQGGTSSGAENDEDGDSGEGSKDDSGSQNESQPVNITRKHNAPTPQPKGSAKKSNSYWTRRKQPQLCAV
ncbi:hypothetical protein G7K_6629-t1 [Saitoella complicata NRRL Y-17804]|uniref:Uncharacterized protein n=2 Tax=Saitoella complicata (strain BCRC 22490 / CBS 7301 / JCM 7358 / NBRC 10748 / NRRL Y-17804) TaxID=698492 RepID=A0A0E9NSC4_SAICN|nr:hypothetical protein G7K_6629-t1 [Saitoella complicata NRRL Y-17804]